MAVTIDEFNGMDAAAARALVSVWAAVPVWADALVAARPYSSADALAEAAGALAAGWSRDDLDAALAHHPRIGARVTGENAEATASRSEQAAMRDAAADVTAKIAAGNAAYEERFGRVFLIRAAGRSPEEMLVALERRLGNDDEVEAAEATAQLAEIALLRLRTDVTDEGVPS
ncbi:2-oxo-4-hydroxy-4-carboxy-5-ureidoimidazoline decarboxylase [Microbacterium aoyamense]|uniref:2-oxo-4-hydroxy-4-carboxy-5-ureidoimidazoline decarboxylase n=1 Tax=Microbacterium aoyamense TaxID=344166 RepID=A0ABP5ARC7_9MICO|nr:2-oxo-4-hydroxy-4-carboxy-5-ureidoimidazoline decarboxylase [Microbacterium aoyamense]